MIETTTTSGRFIQAALDLAATRSWSTVTLADIAERAGAPLVDLKAHFDSKSAILTAFSRLVDDEVLRKAPRRGAEQATRDAIFEVVMSRFDALGPHKAAIRSIAADASFDPARLGPILTSQHWMLAAAGVQTDGLSGLVRTAGLATVYASVFRVWLEDDDAGMARTMAALDRRLRRGEAALGRVDDMCSGARRLVGALMRSRRDPRPTPNPSPGDPYPAPPPAH